VDRGKFIDTFKLDLDPIVRAVDLLLENLPIIEKFPPCCFLGLKNITGQFCTIGPSPE
jgi:hypothetical protein